MDRSPNEPTNYGSKAAQWSAAVSDWSRAETEWTEENLSTNLRLECPFAEPSERNSSYPSFASEHRCIPVIAARRIFT